MKLFSIFLALMLFYFAGNCQLVNIEERRTASSDNISGNISMSATLTQNTKQIIHLKNNIGIQWDKGCNTFLVFNDITWMKAENDDLKNSGFQHFRYNYTFRDTGSITVEGFAQHQYNKVKLLERRFISGGGFRFRIYNKEKTYLYIAPLVMYEYELLDDGYASEESRIKADFYISAGYDFTQNFRIGHVTYYQPMFSDWADFRISSETSLIFKLTKKLSFSIIFDLAYDSHPPWDYKLDVPEQIPDLFYDFRNTLKYSF